MKVKKNNLDFFESKELFQGNFKSLKTYSILQDKLKIQVNLKMPSAIIISVMEKSSLMIFLFLPQRT